MMNSSLAALRRRDFLFFESYRLLVTLGGQILAVALGWQVYEITGRAIHLGWIGLAQFLPVLTLSLLTGSVADRFNRRLIVLACVASSALCAGLLFAQTRLADSDARLRVIYVTAVLLGTTRAFNAPASQSILPALVPREIFPNAVAWHMIVFQISASIGPALGGWVYAMTGGAACVYLMAGGVYLGAFVSILIVRYRPEPREPSAATWKTVMAGLHYVWRKKVLLGAMSLDLFAVLLGGATALLPIFAKDILATGPTGLGILRGAPAVGASLAALILALRPLKRRLGPALFAGVALFGLATVAFGLSRNFALSVAALVIVGASDMVSVAVRHTLIQLSTPDSMRGRVTAVSFVFIGASNELGEFESGVTADWWGAVRSVVYGGLGTVAVVLLWTRLFPSLRRIDELPSKPEEEPAPAPVSTV